MQQLYWLYGEVFVCIVLFAIVHFCVRVVDDGAYKRNSADESLGTKFLDSFYFSLVTQSTVGYGDSVPLSPTAKIVSSLQILVTMWFVIRWALIAKEVKVD